MYGPPQRRHCSAAVRADRFDKSERSVTIMLNHLRTVAACSFYLPVTVVFVVVGGVLAYGGEGT